MMTIYQDGTYLANNESWHAEDSPWKANHVRRALDQAGVQFKTLAEVGCGAGQILHSLSNLYPSAVFSGYEVSPDAYALCKQLQTPRLQFHLQNLLTEDVCFDVLICIDVFEHVEDCFGFLRKLRPKASHHVFHIPLDLSVQSVLRRDKLLTERAAVGHIQYFTKETALATLRDCGYTVLNAFYTSSAIELEKQSTRSRLMKLPRRLAFALAPDLAVRVLGGFSLMVVAR